MSFLMLYIAGIRQWPAEFFVGPPVITVAVMGASVNHVANTTCILTTVIFNRLYAPRGDGEPIP